MASKAWGAELSEHLLDAGEIAGVAHLVEVEHMRLVLPQQAPHHRTAVALGFCAAVETSASYHQDAAAAGQLEWNIW